MTKINIKLPTNPIAMTPFTQIKKRSGETVDFDSIKIMTAMKKAFQAVGNDNFDLVNQLTEQVVSVLHNKFEGKGVPSVEDVQDIVETILIHNDLPKIAKEYILYRHKRSELREYQSEVLATINATISENKEVTAMAGQSKKNNDSAASGKGWARAGDVAKHGISGLVGTPIEQLSSLKTVRKRDGSTEDFSIDKLEASIVAAFLSSNVKESHLPKKVISQVVSQLRRVFDGHTVPSTQEVREFVNIALTNNNLIQVSRKYLMFKYDEKRAERTQNYGNGINVQRYFTTEGVHPYNKIEWDSRVAKISNEKGQTVFEQSNIEVPKSWSQTAVNIVAQKYFRGKIGTGERETSAKQMVDRVAITISDWGRKDGYFQSSEDAEIFEHELTHILINQMAAFNSPVWFNVGINPHPQCSACFINSVTDDMRSILNLCSTEGMLFKGGSGTGTNLSTLRSSKEYLGGSNGRSSGPVSFMKGLDAFAGVIKSGGKTRRAAKMVILNADHPDIKEFINCKAEEEKKAWALIDAGYDGSLDGAAYASIFFQNANNSVRVTDEFIKSVENGTDWTTHEVTTGKPSVSYPAKELMADLSAAAWQCGDPGMQYDTTINKWHTCKNSGRINASNPCSEYMFLDDTACNLSSLNLMKFRKEVKDGGKTTMEFDVPAFDAAARIMITAMEIIIGNSSYPTPAIEQNSHDFRPLGIGYANLGALLMTRGLGYDSDEARNFSAAITSLLSSVTYHQSALIAGKIGPFNAYKENAQPFMEVMQMHRQAAYEVPDQGVPEYMQAAHRLAWEQVVEDGSLYGFRNSQISVLAPTGTIAFLMDCDTTGIEPDIALVKYKWLVGGGMIKIVNNSVPEALDVLGYSKDQVKVIIDYITEKDTIEGAPGFDPKHLPIFDCAFKAKNGTRSIHYNGHIKMMAAVQPFLSGAISKTVNLPNSATPEDITKVYLESARLGLKAVAIYRDGSKRQQPLTTSLEKDQSKSKTEIKEVKEVYKPLRRRLPDERRSLTHKFNIAGHEGYITVGLYDDNKPGEIFIVMAKEGSVVSGLVDAFATAVSMALQYGVPVQALVKKFVHMRFEPHGFTQHPKIRIAKSIVDYLFRWLALKFMTPEEQAKVGINATIEDAKTESAEAVAAPVVHVSQTTIFSEPAKETKSATTSAASALTSTFDNQADAPACETCGSIMVRNAACYKCLNCGSTSGCS